MDDIGNGTAGHMGPIYCLRRRKALKVMGVTVRAQSQQQWLLVSDDTKLGGKGRVLETYLSKEGLEVPPQIASFFPTHETSLLTSVQLSCP